MRETHVATIAGRRPQTRNEMDVVRPGHMFVLIGVAIVLGIFYRAPMSMTYPYDFGWGWGIVGLFFAFFWVFPWIFGWGWWGWRGYRYRRWYRDDDAYQILTERYARGEITKEQFDQMMRDLQQH